MNDIIFNLLLGLGIGALYAMLGAGLVISYKGSGVINFAHGALAMYGMFTFDTAWNRGELFFPWVDFLPTHTLNVPVRITLSDSGTWPMVPSLILALLMATLLGLAAHFLVFRPLRNAAPLGKVDRLARPGALSPGRGAAQLRQLVPPAAEHRARGGDHQLLGSRQDLPAQHALRHRLRSADGCVDVGGVPVHPLRPGHPCCCGQRKGRRPARLLARRPGCGQLGHRLGHSPRSPSSSSARSRERSPRSGSPP